MCHHRVDDLGRFTVAARNFAANDGVRPLDLLVNGLAEIMQQRRRFTDVHIGAQLMRDGAREYGYFNGMRQHVLPVTCAEMQPPQQFKQFGLQSVHAGIQRRPLALFADNQIHFLPRLGYHVLDTRRVDAPIDDEARQCQARNFAAYRIKAGEDHRLRCVIDNQVDAGRRLQRANVAPLAPDNAAFHLIIWQRHHRDYRLGYLVRSAALNRQRNDLARARICFLACLPFNSANAPRRFLTHPTFDTFKQHFLRLILAIPQCAQAP